MAVRKGGSMGDSTSVIALLIVLYGLLFWWAFRTLPQESWQFVASVPNETV